MKICLLIVLLTPFLINAKVTQETRVGLSKKGYEALKKYFPKNEIKRNDYYIDAYNGKDFLLKTPTSPVKFRIKKKKQSAKVQFATATNSQTPTLCGDAPIHYGKKEVDQSQVSSNYFSIVEKSFDTSINAIQNETSNAGTSIKIMQLILIPLKKIGQKFLTPKVQNEKHLYVPTHKTLKYIVKKVERSKKEGLVEVSLRKVIDFDSTGKTHTSYELELEPEVSKLWNQSRLVKYTCKTLGIKHLSKDHFDESRFQAAQENLSHLQNLNDLLDL